MDPTPAPLYSHVVPHCKDAEDIGPPDHARANNPGTVLTFVLPEVQLQLGNIEELLSDEGEAPVLLPYQFHMEEIEGFHYWCREAMRSVMKQAIREVRLKEIKEELKTYFEDNPQDLQLLRHDLPLHPAVVKPHLGHVPDYLVPPALHGLVGTHMKQKKRFSGRKAKAPGKKAKKAKTQNPLRSFKDRGKKPRPAASPP
ncbi:Putative ATP-dependent RNA helicase DDX56 [Heterocephalus glaber]|uniref:Putative ATP-dependent RNA helicase DDX56 n=1 Tax=Heterocephalus glaber TaxID=10181 RepID=G5C781_HETGA|nr:Putative ATP-dependent RNA helicase DDX56 [Heterocephalus glaber]